MDFTYGLKSTHNSMPLPSPLKEKPLIGVPFAIQMEAATPMIAPNSHQPQTLLHPGLPSHSGPPSALPYLCRHYLPAHKDSLIQGHPYPNNQTPITAFYTTRIMATAHMEIAASRYICVLSVRQKDTQYHIAQINLHNYNTVLNSLTIILIFHVAIHVT